MTPAEVSEPPEVRAAFRLLVGAVAVSVASALLQWWAGLRGPEALFNPALEALLLLGLGSRMRGGSQRARTLLLGVAGLFVAVNLAVVAGLAGAFGEAPTQLVVLLMALVGAKLALIAAGVRMMYRPELHEWFR